MKTIVLDEPGQFTLTDTPEPEGPVPGEALVRVRRIGICGTDLKAFEGKMPFLEYPRILGHELGVEIVEISDNNYGVWGQSDTYRGVTGRTSRVDNNYGLYTPDNLYSLNINLTGAIMHVVQNGGKEALEPGDVAVFSGLSAPMEPGGPWI